MIPKNFNLLIVKEYLKTSLSSREGGRFSKEFKSIKEEFMKYNIIKNNYTDDDIYGLLTLSIIFEKPSFEITDKYVEDLVHSFFDVTSNDRVYVPLEEIYGFPSGYKIGACTIITSEELPQSIKNTIDISEKHFAEGNSRSEEVPLPRYWIYTKLDSVGQMKQKEEAYSKIDEALSILRIASIGTGFSCPLFIRRCYMYNLKACRHKTTFFDTYSYFPYWEGLNDKIKIYADLYYKENKSSIETAIINALKIFSLHINATSVEIEFNLVMFAFEGLLLTENDKDYLGTKLSQKAAFLTEKESREERKDIYREMKKMYSKRSSFVHQKKNKKNLDKITSDDLVFIRNVFLRCVNEILSLEKVGTISKISSDGDNNKSLDYYIENLIFS
jgi:hypothetical protein